METMPSPAERIAIPLPSQLGGLADGWADAFSAAVGRLRAGGAQIVPVGTDVALTGTLITQLVESVIQLRRNGESRDGHGPEIAAACLRLAGLSER
jgi:hypothetical protein